MLWLMLVLMLMSMYYNRHLTLFVCVFHCFLPALMPGLYNKDQGKGVHEYWNFKTSYTRKNEQLDQCCEQRAAMLCCTLSTMLCCTLSTTVVNNHYSQLFTINNQCSIIVDNHQQACFIDYIVSSCSNNIVTIIVLCQHRPTIDRTMLINIVNSTSVVEP